MDNKTGAKSTAPPINGVDCSMKRGRAGGGVLQPIEAEYPGDAVDEIKCAPLEDLDRYDCVLIVTDHSDYDYEWIVQHASLVVDTRNATRGIHSDTIVRC